MLLLKCLVFFYHFVCKFVFSTNNYLIKGSALTYRYVILLILVASLNSFLLVEIPGTQKYSYLVTVVFVFKCVNVDDININTIIYIIIIKDILDNAFCW